MTRIRTLKPELWLSPDFRALSVLGKLAFVALICNADDEGRVRTNATHLAEVFLEAIPADVQRQIDLMEQRGMIATYSEKKADYVSVVHFISHQRIDKPTASKLPAPPKHKRRTKRQMELGLLPEHSKNSPGVLSDHSRRTPAVSRKGRDHGKDHGKDHGSNDLSPGGDLALSSEDLVRDPVLAVFDHWRAMTGKTGQTQLDGKRRRVITVALKDYPIRDVLDAVEGWKFIPHNRGENDRHREFNDIELLLRDAKHIETFRDAKRGGVVTAGPVHKLDAWADRVLSEGHDGPK